jgi:arsenate reductase
MSGRPSRVLFLCTGNSARSQMAEALMNERAHGRYVASSAGSHPAARVNPFAIRALREIGIEWTGHAPRIVDEFMHERFDLVITVCDNAKESCPVFPGSPRSLHWGMEDPADATGTDEDKSGAFAAARDLLARRIDELLAELPAPVQPLKFNE